MKLRKLEIVSAIFIAFYPLSSLAVIDGWATSRINARSAAMQLGYSGLIDPFNIWVNPALINNYPNQADIELGTNDLSINSNSSANANDSIQRSTQMGGANIATRTGVVGLYIGRQYRDGFHSGIGTMGDTVASGQNSLGFGSNLNIKAPHNKFDLFYGLDFGKMLFGARVNYSSLVNETNVNDNQSISTSSSLDASEFNLSLGLAFKNSPFDIAVTLGKPSLGAKNVNYKTSIQQTIESKGAWNLGVAARGRFLRTENSFLLAFASYSIENNSSKFNNNISTPINAVRTDKTKSYVVSGAFHYMPSENSLVVTQLGITSNSATTDMNRSVQSGDSTTANELEVKDSTYTVPLTIAFETKVSGKFTVRGSAYKLLLAPKKSKISSKATNQPVSTSDTKVAEDESTVTLAMGLRYDLLSNLFIDAVINQDVLFTGTYLLSGVRDTLSSRLSLIYDFN